MISVSPPPPFTLSCPPFLSFSFYPSFSLSSLPLVLFILSSSSFHSISFFFTLSFLPVFLSLISRLSLFPTSFHNNLTAAANKLHFSKYPEVEKCDDTSSTVDDILTSLRLGHLICYLPQLSSSSTDLKLVRSLNLLNSLLIVPSPWL